MTVTLTGSPRGERKMARKRTDDKPNDPKPTPTDSKPSEGKQINFRASLSLADRLERTASRLGLDVSNFVRMVLMENLPDYESRADEIEAKQRKGGDS